MCVNISVSPYNSSFCFVYSGDILLSTYKSLNFRFKILVFKSVCNTFLSHIMFHIKSCVV